MNVNAQLQLSLLMMGMKPSYSYVLMMGMKPRFFGRVSEEVLPGMFGSVGLEPALPSAPVTEDPVSIPPTL